MVGHQWATQALLKKQKPFEEIMVTVWWSVAGVIHSTVLMWGHQWNVPKIASAATGTDQQKRSDPAPRLTTSPPHVSQITVRKLNELSVEVRPHPPYSPDPNRLSFFRHFQNFSTDKIFVRPDKICKNRFIWIPSTQYLCWRDYSTCLMLTKVYLFKWRFYRLLK